MLIKSQCLISILLASLIILGVIGPTNAALTGNVHYNGFAKGVTWNPIVPMKKVTFVNFDKDSFLDDYSYLAAVPTAVFKDQNRDENRLLSHPLLFYQEKLDYEEDKYRSLDAYQGIHYFMEDWMSYCHNELDQMTLINMEKKDLDEDWKSKSNVVIKGENPYEIAGKIALQDWSYSNNIVVAVIEEDFENPEGKYHGFIEGSIPTGYKIKEFTFEMEKPAIGVGGNYEDFEINEPYKYVVADMYWENVVIDLDLQLYDEQLGMADADSKWNVFYGPGETASSYVYHYGRWEVGVTYMPTQSLPVEGKMKSMYQNVPEDTGLLTKLGLKKKDTQDVDIYLYPGVEIEMNDSIPFGCRNVEFTLTWDNPNIALGFLVLDPAGAETASTPSKEEIIRGLERGITERTIKMEKLGETTENDKYKICVFTLDNATRSIDFKVEYSWNQNITRKQGDSLASATEGAVLSSLLNAPLLYTARESVPKTTRNTLYKLGAEHIYLVNLGGHLARDAKEELKNIGKTKEFTEYKAIYDQIRDLTGSNDVIFSTIDPWTYYYAGVQKPVDEYPGALFIGPAAYIGACHGSPVLLVDNHPELSQAVVWHTKFWQETANVSVRPHLPSVAIMVLTGRNVIKFLESYEYNLPMEKDKLATMITVADHFDIGITWDRTFTGRLIPGRFLGSPVDTSYWIARDVFYPALIFENPALQDTITLVNGSKSVAKPYIGKLLPPLTTDLHIIRESQPEKYKYPILHTYNVYLYNFNRDASKHWGTKYATANGIIPYETPSQNPIDEGAVPEKNAAYYPDLHETEVTPFYGRQAGYSNCFSTNFDITIENLNKGVIMWMESCHGSNDNYGNLGFWNPDSPYVYESNPWRAYERPLFALRNINEAMKYLPDYLGVSSLKILFGLGRILTIPLNLITVDQGSTAHPDQAVYNPEIHWLITDAFGVDLHIKESKGLSLIPLIGRKYRAYGDGIVIDPSFAGENVLLKKNGIDFDEKLGNLHCMGLNAVSCLIANTYLHLVMIRHGTAYQILDPWTTSWYSGLWLHSIPRQLALGYTIGEAYEQGMAEVGIEYLVNQWWWDLNENVVFYGDPDLRVWTPNTKWDPYHKNYWEVEDVRPFQYNPVDGFMVDGHTPFGAQSHPNKIDVQPEWLQYLLIFIAIVVLALIIILIVRKKEK